MDFLKEKATVNELRVIKAVTGLAIGGVSIAMNEELPVGKLACTAAGTTMAVMNTSERDTRGFCPRENAIWETVGSIALTTIVGRLFS
ncbi:hypothetical protein FDJ25_gp035 [Vibrio phage Aphrodite1]|uniref:Uncharacterized protein n=1 Tax=Vibrio phage Aphrodite1 TaxID=2070057 RepID=A0A2I7QI75_9CAUD|nr:hypothetical protein FDJ25_gp035 [Vibrio phage Aphrodite1]AUR81097.1 hypothetical protein Aphrodite1_0173 [Vibrio phage Aphrodite1]